MTLVLDLTRAVGQNELSNRRPLSDMTACVAACCLPELRCHGCCQLTLPACHMRHVIIPHASCLSFSHHLLCPRNICLFFSPLQKVIIFGSASCQMTVTCHPYLNIQHLAFNLARFNIVDEVRSPNHRRHSHVFLLNGWEWRMAA